MLRASYKNSESMDSLTNKTTDLTSVMPIIREQLSTGGTVEFSPRGVSMLPMLRQGRDTVTLSAPPARLKKYDLPLYVRDNGQYVLHRIVSVKDGYSCIGDNQFVLETGVRQDQIIAIVTSFCRDGKRIDVSALSYRIYCRFWHYSRGVRHTWRRAIGKVKRILNRRNTEEER